MKSQQLIAQGYFVTTKQGEVILASPIAYFPSDATPTPAQIDEAVKTIEEATKRLNLFNELVNVLKKTEWELERIKSEMIKPDIERDSFWISTFFQSSLGGMARLKEIKDLIERAEKK